MAIERTGRISGGFGGSRRGSSGPKIGCSGCSLVTVRVCHLSREARWVGKASNPRLSPPCRSPVMDHLVLCASHPPGQTARRPVSTAQWKRGLDRRGLRCPDHGPGYGIELKRRLRIGLVHCLGPPDLTPGGRDVRSPRRRYAQPGQLLRGYPSVGGGFTNPSPTPIRLRGCPSLTSCLSLPVAFLWRSWRRESCCSCHPCLYQPWRPLQLSVALLVPPDLMPPVRCLTSKRPIHPEGVT